MARRMDLLNRITKQLAVLAYEIELMNRSNRMTLNSDAETIFCGLINRLEGWNLRNLNEVSQNYPGIDLADPQRRIAVQITASASAKKVSHTLEVFFKNHMEREFDRLVLVITTDRTAPTNGGTVKPGFRFDPKKDIWNIEWFKRRVEAVEDCELLQAVADYLDSQLGDLPGSVKRPDHLLPPVPSGSEFFLEGSRDAELEILEKAMEKGPVFIWGLGGMGKTEVAIALANRCEPPRGAYFLRYTVPADPDREAMFETIRRADISGYALDAGDETDPEILMEQEYREKLEILRREYEDTLLVIDNFDCPGRSMEMLKAERSYQDVAALANNGVSLVFTTRYPGDPAWEVKPLPEERLLELMRKSCADYEDEQLLELIRAVGGHTLMVDLMAKTLEESWQTVTPEDILAALKNARLDMEDFPEVTTDKDGTYAQAQIYKHLQALFNLSGLNNAARKVLSLAILIADEGLDDVLFLGSLPADEKKELQNLCKRGWLRREDHVVTIHPAVLQVCRGELQPEEAEVQMFLDALWAAQEKRKCSDATLRRVAQCMNAGIKYIQNQKKAVQIYLKAISIWEQVLQEYDPKLALRYGDAGMGLFELGQFDYALKYTKKSLSIKKKTLPRNHPDIARFYRRLGMSCSMMYDFDNAAEYQRKALEILERILPEDHPDLVMSCHQLGISLFRLENYTDALKYLLPALNARKQLLRPYHPDLLESYIYIGKSYIYEHRYDEALLHLEDAISILEQNREITDEVRAQLYFDYGWALGSRGSFALALKYLEEARALFENYLPENDDMILTAKYAIQMLLKAETE